jgi:gluconate 5-dehydrogenase
MIKQKGGSIINISSLNGQSGASVRAGMTAYATSKVGVIGLTRSLAAEWGRYNIRVNAVLPGNMEEGMMEFLQDKESPTFKTFAIPLLNITPLNRFGSGDDMKGIVVFLASKASSYISGEKILVDGAITINLGL